MRPVVRYDDIAGDARAPEPSGSAPARKRTKTQASETFGHSQKSVQHWDDPGTTSQAMNYDEEDAPDTQDGFEESRQLTHEEIWDDSALVDAWNAANEEYEALNGPDKSWKKDPVFKSPLWYNTPAIQKTPQAGPSSPNKRTKTKTAPADDSQPLNFENFVPNHDPSLAANGAGPTYASPGIVGQDEAFTRAVEASYWSGYWTAVYHYHRHMPTGRNTEGEDEQEEVTAEVEDGMVAEEDGDDMISTQR